MKIDRQDITRFVKNIKHEYPEATDKEFAEHLCKYMETNPGCVDPKGVPTSGNTRILRLDTESLVYWVKGIGWEE